MAYGEKLSAEFWNKRFRTRWKVRIYEKDYTGASSTMMLTGRPTLIRKVGTEDLFQIMQGTEATINIQHQPGDDYDYLFTANARKFRVEIDITAIKGGAVAADYWRGYILPGQSVAGFDPYRTISIVAGDGLGMLKNQPFINPVSEIPYEGYETLIVILARALAYTGLELNMIVASNLMPEEYNTAPADSVNAYNVTSIQQRRFQDLLLKPVSCYTVIEEILRSMVGVKIFQCFAKWYIVRTHEQFDNNIFYIEFSDTGGYVTNGTLDMLLTMTDNAGDPLVVPLWPAQLENKFGNRSIKVIRDDGVRTSIFPGFNFPDDEFTEPLGSALPTEFRHFTCSPDSDWTRLQIGDNNILANIDGVGHDPDANYIESDAIPVRVSVVDQRTLSLTLKCGAFLTGGANVNISLYIDDGAGSYYYWKSDFISDEWVQLGGSAPASPAHGSFVLKFPNVKSSNTPEDAIEAAIDAIPCNGDLYIRIWDYDYGVALSVNPWISEIILVQEDPGFPVKPYNALIDAENVNIPPDVRTLFNRDGGPNNNLVFADGILVHESLYSYNVGVSSWSMRNAVTATYGLNKWICQMYIDNDLKTLFRGTVISELFHFYNVLKIPEYDDRIFVPDDVIIDLKAASVNGTFIEVKDITETISLTKADDVPAPVSAIQTNPDVDSYSGSSVGSSGGTTEFDGYRNGEEAVVTGNQTITFSSNFPVASTWRFSELRVITSDGFRVEATITNETISGFDIEVKENATLSYTVMLDK